MAYPKALEDGEVRSVNIKSIRQWIESNKALIKAKPGKTVGYGGRDYDLDLEELAELEKKATPPDRMVYRGTPIYKILKMTKPRADLKLPADFQTLETVLKSIRRHPKIVTRDRKEIGPYANAYEFFTSMKDFAKLVPGTASVECDKLLSEIYMHNAQGDIRILDGASDGYEKLGRDKILINTELIALLKSADKLSLEGKKELLRVISKYRAELETVSKQFTQMKLQLVKDVKVLTRR